MTSTMTATHTDVTGHGSVRGPIASSSRPSSHHTRTPSASSAHGHRKVSSRDQSFGDLSTLTALKPTSENPSSPDAEASTELSTTGRIGPKRRSRIGMAALSTGTEAPVSLKRTHKTRGSTASLKSLGQEKVRKPSLRHRAKADADDAWISASGGESASHTPERTSPVSTQATSSRGLPGEAETAHVSTCSTHAGPYEDHSCRGQHAQTSQRPLSADLAKTPTVSTEHIASVRTRSSRRAQGQPGDDGRPLKRPEPVDSATFGDNSLIMPAPMVQQSSQTRPTRKASNASNASRLSTRSMRRPLSTVVALAPRLDTSESTGQFSTSLPRFGEDLAAQRQHTRAASTSSVQASDTSSDLAQILRDSAAPSRHVPSSLSRTGLNRISSGLSGLRGLLPLTATASSPTTDAPSQPPHPPPGLSAGQPSAGSGANGPHTATATTTTSSSSPRPYVSRFITPLDHSSPVDSAIGTPLLDATSRSSSSSLNRPLNRTQQRLMMQRAQPYRDPDSSPNARQTLLPPLNASTSPGDAAELNLPERQLQCQQAQRDWAKLLCREAERVDREHECVLRYRDPAGESFRRIIAAKVMRGRSPALNAATAVSGDARGKQRRPDSLQRSLTTR